MPKYERDRELSRRRKRHEERRKVRGKREKPATQTARAGPTGGTPSTLPPQAGESAEGEPASGAIAGEQVAAA